MTLLEHYDVDDIAIFHLSKSRLLKQKEFPAAVSLQDFDTNVLFTSQQPQLAAVRYSGDDFLFVDCPPSGLTDQRRLLQQETGETSMYKILLLEHKRHIASSVSEHILLKTYEV